WNFTPFANTSGTLQPVSINEPDGEFLVSVGSVPGRADLYDLNFFSTNPLASNEALNRYPTLFRYATPEGYVYVIDETDGLHSVTDPNGNTLTITRDGITHSSGKNVRFERDSQGRITAIIDAAGNAMTYDYDATGNLVAFHDRENNATKFSYDGAHNL